MKAVRLLVGFLALGGVLAGCAADTTESAQPTDTADASEDLTSTTTLAFKVLDVTKSGATEGLTVLRSASEYKAFFGHSAPSGVFPTSWVLHYSMGVEKTGGYSVEATGVTRHTARGQRVLDLALTTHSPGPKCAVTMSLTNPQVAVIVRSQSATTKAKADIDAQVDLCGGCTEPSQCPVPKIACQLCDDGSSACPEPTCNDGECGFVINQCPEHKTCGGFANLPCPDGYSCVDNPNDGCDPNNGGADCGGICQKSEPQFCGGIAAFPCPDGYSCVDNPNDDCDPAKGGADCGGICQKQEQPQFCGGFAGIACPKGYSCVDNPSDDCDPNNGGADCGGICVQSECSGPIPDCAAPPEGCHYEGGGCVDGSWTCGKLTCGEPCGDVVCGEGTVCCNPLMGICTKPGMVCIQLAWQLRTQRVAPGRPLLLF